MGFQFAAVLAFAGVAIVLIAATLAIFRLIRPHFPLPDKEMIYECGERPIGKAWFNFNPRFYLIALVFVIFEVDIALTFPVVAVYREWVGTGPGIGWLAFAELFLFTAILGIGLVWVWIHGDLEWSRRLETIEPFDEKPAHTNAPARRVG
jgi:NADH-quinone oxidoreductase subunit A